MEGIHMLFQKAKSCSGSFADPSFYRCWCRDFLNDVVVMVGWSRKNTCNNGIAGEKTDLLHTMPECWLRCYGYEVFSFDSYRLCAFAHMHTNVEVSVPRCCTTSVVFPRSRIRTRSVQGIFRVALHVVDCFHFLSFRLALSRKDLLGLG